MDSTFIRSREKGERHPEVLVGNVETASGGRQVFGAVEKADTDLSALIRRAAVELDLAAGIAGAKAEEARGSRAGQQDRPGRLGDDGAG